MRKRIIHSKKELKLIREILRQNLTPAEAFLWKQLKARQFEGRRFTKQHSVAEFIVDFYCAKERLIIELDGEVHNNPVTIENDERRTAILESLNYKVLRFENKMVFDSLPSVLEEIKSNFKD